MMSKKQWFVLLCVQFVYLLLGAAIFLDIESTEEKVRREEEAEERKEIADLLRYHYKPSDRNTQKDIMRKLTAYCGKPMDPDMAELDDPPLWNFYHALFFVIQLVSTIGYGNLVPTTTVTRIFTIFYGLIGIPMNGIVIVSLGDFFGKSFIKLYDRWKTVKMQHALATLGLIGQIILYLVPGFTFFIILPSIIMSFYEGWPYEIAVYYCFITLTTVGFGDFVAGMNRGDYGEIVHLIYETFLIAWIVVGLGYIVMVLGFITRGMQSKKMHAFEHKIAVNIKRTNHRIREELRSVLNEYLLMKVKRVYRDRFVYVPSKCNRSQSCPDLTMWRSEKSPKVARKRAFSECRSAASSREDLQRIQSDTDLQRIDMERTFRDRPATKMVESSQLILKVVNALGNCDINNRGEAGGVQGFSDSEILSSERYNCRWSIGSHKLPANPPNKMRRRAASEYQIPCSEKLPWNSNDLTWYGPSATKRLQELRDQTKREGLVSKTLPPHTPTPPPQPGLITRLRQNLRPNKNKVANLDVESQNAEPAPVPYIRQNLSDRAASVVPTANQQVLEETSLADFIRAIAAISVPEIDESGPRRKMGVAGLVPPKHQQSPRTRRKGICPVSRRPSLAPLPTPVEARHRRFSFAPLDVGLLDRNIGTPPPPYSVHSDLFEGGRRRRVSSVGASGPVQRQAARQRNDTTNRDGDNESNA